MICLNLFYIVFLKFLVLTCAVTLDILLTVQAWGSMEWTKIVRYLLKFIVAIAWMVILPVTYSSSIKYPSGAGKILNSWIGNWYNQSVYNVAIVIYMIPNILAALFFLLPQLQNFMERSNSRVFVLLMWWTQVSPSYSSLDN
jgi:callose synthase